jgi:hypothetical protein
MGLLLLAVVSLTASGCVPFSVGTTARPVPEGEVVPSMAIYSAPGGSVLEDDSARVGTRYALLDAETRFGIDGRSDLGVRIPGMSGVVVNYKRVLSPSASPDRVVLSGMVGGGIVNAGNHFHFEGTLLASGPERTVTPFGALRAMQVVPVSSDAVSDSPSLGVVLGLRIGRADLGVSPELAVYYDRSALGLRDSKFIVIPSITIHGADLLRALRY